MTSKTTTSKTADTAATAVLEKVAGALEPKGTRKPRSTRKPAASKATAPAKAPSKKAEPKPERKAPEFTPMTSGAPKGHPGHTWAKELNAAQMSQTAAAKAMGVAPMSLNRLVNGKGIPTAAMTLKFAHVLDADVDALWLEVARWEMTQARAAAKK